MMLKESVQMGQRSPKRDPARFTPDGLSVVSPPQFRDEAHGSQA